jgi:hypothetical protein
MVIVIRNTDLRNIAGVLFIGNVTNHLGLEYWDKNGELSEHLRLRMSIKISPEERFR